MQLTFATIRTAGQHLRKSHIAEEHNEHASVIAAKIEFLITDTEEKSYHTFVNNRIKSGKVNLWSTMEIAKTPDLDQWC